MSRGRFIAVEGVDGCGKSTQSKRLAETLNALHVTAVSGSPMGELARQYLRAEHEFPGDNAFQLLLAADRAERTRMIYEVLESGRHVVADRWSLSGFVYGAINAINAASSMTHATASHARESWHRWFGVVDERAAIPDLYIVLEVTPEVAAQRMLYRTGRDRWEGEPKVRAALAEYRWWSGRGGVGPRIVFVNAHAMPDEVAAHMLAETGIAP